MKKYLLIILLLSVSFSLTVFSQDETAIIIGDQKISRAEFERLYKKNISTITNEQNDLEDYLERFINFKLKVIEAENMGLDTTESFNKELKSYRKELAKPYMIDSAYQDYLLQKAYNKIKYELNASHVLISLHEGAGPEDTLAAWNKINDIRNKAIKGEDFGKLAEQSSDDPSAATNKGNLGWFGAFRSVHEFDERAYATKPGNISEPVRTRFGYHIIKVNETRPARGAVHVAHIYINVPGDAPDVDKKLALEKINQVHKELEAGADFSEMAQKYSDDQASAKDGGLLPWFSSGMIIPEFESAAFLLKYPGDYSEPFQTQFGWHIVKLIDKKPIGTFEEEKAELLNKINTEGYNADRKNAFIEKLKKDHNFTFYGENFANYYTFLNSSFYEGSWSASAVPDGSKVLFTIGNKKYTRAMFGKYLEDYRKPATSVNLQVLVNEKIFQYIEDALYDYEESSLAERFDDFNYLLKEYHDGILLFDLTDKKVWSKAVNDSVGLKNFFKKNIDNYKWDEPRAEAYIITVSDSTLLKAARSLTSKKAGKKGFSKEFLLNELCPEDSTGTCIDLVYGKFEKGKNEIIDAVEWKKGIKESSEKYGLIRFVYINKILKPGAKELDETRGIVISDYQEYLDKEWIKELRAKYSVTVNQEVISRIK